MPRCRTVLPEPRDAIERVVVDQDARGHGVGTALTMAAIDLAQQQGARSIDLTYRTSRLAANPLPAARLSAPRLQRLPVAVPAASALALLDPGKLPRH